MQYFMITLAAFGIFITASAVGVIFSNKPLKGSCGGLGKIMGNKCDYCSREGSCKKDNNEAA